MNFLEQLDIQRCLLFVPGARPDRFDKAVATGVDMVCIDLEDAVLPNEKEAARNSTVNYFLQRSLRETPSKKSTKIGVRINSLIHQDGLRDILAFAATTEKPDFIMLPKVSEAAEIRILDAHFSESNIDLIALIESPGGIANCANIATSSPRLKALMLGGADLSVELGAKMQWDALLMARSQLVAAAAYAGVAAIDVPFLDIKDSSGLERETRRIIELGFTTKSAIHPTQVNVIQQCFLPELSEIENAKKIVTALEQSQSGAIQVDGRLVDKPVILAAQKILELAKLKKSN